MKTKPIFNINDSIKLKNNTDSKGIIVNSTHVFNHEKILTWRYSVKFFQGKEKGITLDIDERHLIK